MKKCFHSKERDKILIKGDPGMVAATGIGICI